MENQPLKNLPDTLDVKHIQEILKCGRLQAYTLVKSDAFHVVRVRPRIKISKGVFYLLNGSKDVRRRTNCLF